MRPGLTRGAGGRHGRGPAFGYALLMVGQLCSLLAVLCLSARAQTPSTAHRRVVERPETQEKEISVSNPIALSCGPKTAEEVCKIVDGIRVCEGKYVRGTYECADFAQDFCKESRGKGVDCRVVLVTCFPDPKKAAGHALSVVEVKSNISGARSFCLYEPQTNQKVGCWTTNTATWAESIPPWIHNAIQTKYHHFDPCKVLQYAELGKKSVPITVSIPDPIPEGYLVTPSNPTPGGNYKWKPPMPTLELK